MLSLLKSQNFEKFVNIEEKEDNVPTVDEMKCVQSCAFKIDTFLQ